mmetsp:Transcript_175/g.257  ORF Transcript_175/g.257 Transcript_175/m.257 type:complete len:499 (+) Transcript_175:48-1544(+)|eukprot:CAMPEP_0184862146 /NCGR_PEP_ID=MMETSP0580-20130426/6659_1 /TAXON_ID=1118495 /ORGANISM="Dactyliosolen fragilissimus" /LENGTH=498 /DNA_ID=CAMNT_0027359887 /DNA_START=36 /DNA_END=1532 /DNA_ORIENTATION=+
MDLLKKELERKRRAVEQAKEASSSNDDNGVIRITTEGGNERKRTTSYLKAGYWKRYREEQEEKEEEERRKNKKWAMMGIREEKQQTTKLTREGLHGKKIGDNQDGVENKVNKSTFNSLSKRTHSLHSKVHNGHKSEKGVEKLKFSSTVYVMDKNSKLKRCTKDKDTFHLSSSTSSSSAIYKSMTKQEISDALRELGIPVRLFGETNDRPRIERLKEARESRKAALVGMSDMDEFRLGSGHGIRNPFLGGKKGEDDNVNTPGSNTEIRDSVQSHTNSSNAQYIDSISNKLLGKTSIHTSTSTNYHSHAESHIYKPHHILRLDNLNGNPNIGKKDEEDYSNDPHKLIHCFFKSLLKQWEYDLSQRPLSIQRTNSGRNETKTLKQCKDYIRSLFKLCKARTLEEGIMGKLVTIVNHSRNGEFVKAHDAYMDVAIGRAAWPIGVTMVGIHARSGRARIESSNVAHVMNSELQRKYLTSVKRLISYYQNKRTDVAPSKKVLNM